MNAAEVRQIFREELAAFFATNEPATGDRFESDFGKRVLKAKAEYAVKKAGRKAA